MSNPKLILVEGIPGSGKTTTARFVCDWLERHGKQPALFLEGDWNHPADYESVACLSDSEYAELQARFPEFVSFLAHHAKRENDQWLFSYRKLEHEQRQQAPADLFKTLAKFEIYDLPAEKHKQVMRRGWQNFVTQAISDNFTYVFECCFLQNPTTTLLARHNQPIAAIHQHLLDLAALIRTLEPRLIYLAPDPHTTLENIRQERPPDWANYVTWYLTEQEFGKAHGLKDFKGVSDFYTIRQALELELLSLLPIPSITITDAPDWSGSKKHLEAFLEA